MKDWLPFVGVVMAQFVLVGLFFVRQRADDKRRWHEKRIVSYMEFVTLARAYDKILPSQKWTKNMSQDEMREVRLRINAAHDSWMDSYFDIQLLASDPVRDAGAELVEKYNKAADWEEGLFRGEESGSFAEWMHYRNSTKNALGQFQAAVRHELGVSRPSRRYVVVADSRGELLWNFLEAFMSVGYGHVGRWLMKKIRPGQSTA